MHTMTFGPISFVILKNGLIRKSANRNLLEQKRQKTRMAWRKIQTTSKIQGNRSVQSAVIFDQRQVTYFDFEEPPTETENLWSLLHPANDEHEGTKAKNKRKVEATTAAQIPAPKKLREKYKMDGRK